MAESREKTKDSKVFDVAKPGKTAPPLTSKPVIVTNRQVLKDPMVVDEEKPMEQEEPVKASAGTSPPSTSKVKIEPLSKPEDLKTSVKEQPETDNVTADEDEAVAERDTIKDASAEAEAQELLDKKLAEHQANMEKIALAKTYYLPINQIERRRSKHIAIGGAILIILLGLVWADVALDAGLVTLPGVKAPTHFFSK